MKVGSDEWLSSVLSDIEAACYSDDLLWDRFILLIRVVTGVTRWNSPEQNLELLERCPLETLKKWGVS